MMTQRRRTGGLRILSDKLNMHVDPGPGALVYSIEMGLSPQNIDAILISHSHLDHTNDANVLLEAMTQGGREKKGTLAAAHSVLHGNDVCDRAISNYHRGLPQKIVDATVGTAFDIGSLKVRVGKAVHHDPDTVGFRFETEGFGDFGYMPDSEYFEDLPRLHEGTRLMILSVLRPTGKPWKGHMTTEDAARIIGEVRPEMALITHFGMEMIFKGPDRQAGLIERKTGIPTIAAKDGMHLTLGEEITVGKPKKQAGLESYL